MGFAFKIYDINYFIIYIILIDFSEYYYSMKFCSGGTLMNSINCDTVEIVGLSAEYPVNSTTFKQFQVQHILEVPPEKLDIKKIIRVTVSGEVLSTRIIETPQAVSNEGQRLTGYKMMVEGKLIQKIEYIADNIEESFHELKFIKPFSNYIMLEENTCYEESLNVEVHIEDVYVRELDARKIFNNVILLLNAHPIHNPTSPKDTYEERYNKHFNIGQNSKRSFFSQLCVEDTIIIPRGKPDIESVITSIVEPEILSLKFIDTMRGVSSEGQILTGKKAVLEIKFRQKILYAADMPEQSVHGMENEFYRCAYVVLPCSIEGTAPELLANKNLLKPKVIIENVFIKQLDNRRIIENIAIFIELKLFPTFAICYSIHNSNNESDLFMMYAEGNHETPITCKDNYCCIKPQWSPLGNEVAYLKGDEQGYMLYLLNIKSLKSRQITSFNRFDNITGFSWICKGKKVAFTAAISDSKDIYIFDIVNQSFARLTNGMGLLRNFNPRSSPAGNEIAYIRASSEKKNIWIMDISGKNNVPLTEDSQIRDFNWTMDGRSIVYADSREYGNDALYIIDIYSKKIRLLVDNPFVHKIKKVKISPDNRYAAFVTTSSHREDLFIYELKTGKIKDLTGSDYNSGICDFIWNIDSTIIYYASKDMDCYNIYSIALQDYSKLQLTKTNSSFIEMSYRPTIM
jgi:Tol biopolymer transport system component